MSKGRGVDSGCHSILWETQERGDLGQLIQSSHFPGTSLVVRWLRLCLPMQGSQVCSLVGNWCLGTTGLESPPATMGKSLCTARRTQSSQNTKFTFPSPSFTPGIASRMLTPQVGKPEPWPWGSSTPDWKIKSVHILVISKKQAAFSTIIAIIIEYTHLHSQVRLPRLKRLTGLKGKDCVSFIQKSQLVIQQCLLVSFSFTHKWLQEVSVIRIFSIIVNSATSMQ